MSKAKLEKELKSALPKIIIKIQEGDVAAQNEFATLLLPYISSLIAKYKNTIDDVIQSLAGRIIMKLLSKVDTIDTTKSVMGFITRTAINRAIDEHRKFKVNRLNNTVEYQAFRDYDTSYQMSGVCADSIENVESVLKEHLCDEDAGIVSLYYLHNKSLQDIADSTGYRIKDIQHTLDYARRNISRSLVEVTNGE